MSIRKYQKISGRHAVLVTAVFAVVIFFAVAAEAQAAQFARPDSDVSIGSWTGDPTNTSGNRYQNIDEATASDTDFVRSESDPSNSAAEFGLGNVADPNVDTGHVVRYRYRKGESGGGQPGTIDITVELRQGTTVIASQVHAGAGTSFTDGSFTLTSGEAGNITDYTDLRVRFIANKSAGTRTSWGEVSWGELEVPELTPTLTQQDYRWRNDDGNETGATWKATANTAISGVNDSDQLRVRISYEETAGGSANNTTARLEFSSDATSCTTGAWTAISTSTSEWKLFDSTQFTEPISTTQQISSASFVAGELLDQTNPTTLSVTLTSQATEFEWAIQNNSAAASTTYRFRVTDNGTALDNYAQCAQLTTADAAADTSPPDPDPMAFASPFPDSKTTSSISISATSSASDATPPIEYLFINVSCTSDGGAGGASSTWITSSSFPYTDSGLEVNKCYAYQVQARDSVSPTPNTGTASASSSAYTRANIPGAPTLGSPATSTLTLTNAENGNPTSSPATLFAVFVSSTSPNDSDFDGFWLDTGANATSASEVWAIDETWDGFVISGLNTSTTYTLKVKARNSENEETTLSAAGSGTTTETVDTAPPSPDPPTFFQSPANDSASAISMSATTSTDASPPVEYLFAATSTTCGADYGSAGHTSSSWQINTAYTDTGLSANRCYGYTLTARDSASTKNYTATSSATSTYTSANTPGAPTLSGATTSTLNLANAENGNPSSNPTTLFAVQASSTDSDWDGFWLDTDGTTSTASEVWAADGTWDVTVQLLEAGTTYGFRVKARNQNNDETPLSAEGSGTTATETDPPTPDPATFEVPPANDSATAISMQATTSTDASPPVEYLFAATSTTCGADYGSAGHTSSSWQTATAYTDSGLSTNRCYAYTVRARDANGTMNAASAATSTYTSANTPGAPTLSGATTSTLNLANAENGNPSSNPTTLFAVFVSSTSPNDPTWQGQWVDTVGDPSASESWNSDGTWDGLTIRGLATSTIYTLKVKARNQNSDETVLGAAGSGTTESGVSNSAPGAPTLDSPASGAENLSTTPVFKMTASDSDGDHLQHKVTIYSNSACTTVVQTNDQTVSQTGWSGQNASSGAAYASGSQATFTVQSALSQNTTYYWRASAKDPDGSNTWTDSASCVSFATASGELTTDSGSWSTASNQLATTPSSGAEAEIHVEGVSRTDSFVDVRVKSSAVGAGTGRAGVTLRSDGGSNKYWLGADFLNNKLIIGKTVSGVFSVIASSSFTFSADTFYQLRAKISGTSLEARLNGTTTVASASDSSLGGAGFAGLAASSTSGTATFTFDNLAVYSSSIITLNGLPADGSWAVRDSAGAVIFGSCTTGSTWDMIAYSGSVPIDAVNGGASIAVWTGNTTCSGGASITNPSSGLANIFGGDVFSYVPASEGDGGTVVATSSAAVSSGGLISL